MATMTAQEVITASSTDLRGILQNSGSGANTLLGWVDRIHKDALHTSIYQPFNVASTPVTSVAGTGSYTLSASNIRRVLQVYDRNFNRELLPFVMITAPMPSGSSMAPPIGTPSQEQARPSLGLLDDKTQSAWARYFRFIAPTTLVLFPAPLTATYAGTLEVYYEQQITDVTSTSQTLVVPSDGLDMMAAGVNYLANIFLRRAEEATMWLQIYENLKRGIANV